MSKYPLNTLVLMWFIWHQVLNVEIRICYCKNHLMSSAAHRLFWTCRILNICLDFFYCTCLQKQQQIFDSQNSTRPNRWAAEDISFLKFQLCSFLNFSIQCWIFSANITLSKTSKDPYFHSTFRQKYYSFILLYEKLLKS